VFDAMLARAMRLTGAVAGHLMTYDGKSFTTVASQGGALQAGVPVRPQPGDVLERLVQGDPLVHVAKVLEDPAYQASLRYREWIERSGIRSFLIVALRQEGALRGAIGIFSREQRPFTDKQIALLQNFAAQAVIAMENGRLITETREALEQQTATAEVLGVINSSPGDLAPVFDAILEKAHALCGAEHGSMVLREGNFWRAVAPRNYTEAFAGRLRQGFDGRTNPAIQPLIDGARFVQIPDLTETDHPVSRAAAELGGLRTGLFVPLRRNEVLLGHISASRPEVRPFTEKQVEILENFAAQADVAKENARLLDELRQRTDEVAELNRGLEARGAEQVEELGGVGRLKRFLAPQLAELIVSQGDEKILESHRREIVVVFCDLRGYTAFTETAEPEEVLDFLREYHGALGPLVSQFEGTLDQFSGDGIMVFFNDPVPCADPAERAVKMAMAMREKAAKLITAWRERGRELGFGAGIAQG